MIGGDLTPLNFDEYKHINMKCTEGLQSRDGVILYHPEFDWYHLIYQTVCRPGQTRVHAYARKSKPDHGLAMSIIMVKFFVPFLHES